MFRLNVVESMKVHMKTERRKQMVDLCRSSMQVERPSNNTAKIQRAERREQMIDLGRSSMPVERASVKRRRPSQQ